MSEFNKTYNQIIKTYHLTNQASLWDSIKNSVSSVWKFIAKGPKAFLDTITGWFNNMNEKNAQSYSEKISKLINFGSKKDDVISEGPIDWFKSLCNQVKTGIKMMKSKQEVNKFKNYLINKKQYTPEKIKNISFSDCKNNLKDFVDQELAEKNIVSESNLQQNGQIISELATTIGFTVCFCIVVGVSYWVWTEIRDSIGIGEVGAANKEIAGRKAKQKNAKDAQRHKQEMNNLTIQSLTSALKGCEALR